MLEITLGAARPADKIDLKVPTAKLLVKATIPKVAGVTAMAAFLAAVANAVVTATRYSEAKGNKQQFENLPLLDLVEMAASNEGYIQLDGADAATSCVAKFTLELCNNGAVAFSAKDYLTVQFAGFDLFTSFEVRSFGAAVEIDEHLKISAIACNANAQVRFGCVSAYAVALPTSLHKLIMTYQNGVVQEIEGADLELIAPDYNEILYLVNGAIVSTGKWRLFPIPSGERGAITLTADGFAYLLSNKNYE